MLSVLALAALASIASRGNDLDALVSRIAQAYGGEKALARVKAWRASGTLESSRGLAKTVRVFAPPDRLRVEISYPGGNGELRVLRGDEGWRNGESVVGAPRDAMVLQAARLDLPGLLVRNRASLVDLGDVKHQGKILRGIGLPLEGRLNVAITVDPETALIVRSEGALPGPGGGIRFATEYSDFRKVDGVLFAFREENFAGGQHTGETRLEKIEVLASVPSELFPP